MNKSLRLKNCHSQEEFLKLAKEEGIALSQEQLEALSGGACSSSEENKEEKGNRIIGR